MKKLFFTTIIAFIIILLILRISENNKLVKNNEDVKIVYNLGSEYNTLDPHLFSEMIAAQVDSSIYEGLLIIDRNGEYSGGVAESYIETDTKLIFKLREDVKWSDGSQITAYDFVYGFKRALNPETAAQFADMLYPIKNAELVNSGELPLDKLGVRALNDKELEIELEYPTAYFKYILTLPISFPLKEDFFVLHKDNFAVEIDGFLFNGPYKIIKMEENEIQLIKNEYYWNAKNIQIEEIVYKIVTNFSTVDTLIKNGELTMSRVEPYNIDLYRNNGNLESFLNGRVWYLEFNISDNQYLQNKKLRQSISMAIDREKYVDEIKRDGSKIAKSVISEIIKGGKYRDKYNDTEYIEENIEKARLLYEEALSELGVESLTLRLLSGNSDPEVLEIQFIQEELRSKLGLETIVEIVPFKERLVKTRSGDYDITLNTWSPKYYDAMSYLERWQNKENSEYWSKNKYNDLLRKIVKLPDSDSRDELINQAELILIEDLPIVPLYYSIENHYKDNRIQNVLRYPVTGIADFRWAYILP